jgi:predicted RNA-binding Zn ribbon-like protein
MSIERFGPTHRGGPLFRWLGGPLAIDLANTVMVVREGERVDLLATREDFRRWLDAERKRLARYRFNPGDLAEVRELRDAIRGLLTASVEGTVLPPEALTQVNSVSAADPVAPRLAMDLSAELRATGDGGGSLDRLLGIVARSAIELLAGPEADSLKICRAPSCGMFFLGARRWCCSACGNRARAARHYRRAKNRLSPQPARR